MAGLAAALNVPGIIDALAMALAPRGADSVVSRLKSTGRVPIDVAVRAVIPTIPRVVGGADSDEEPVVAAFAIDGVASVSALDAGYTVQGPAGLLGGAEPYAVILVDVEQEALVLARNGNGAGLYYARHAEGWVAASEPIALVRAGVPAVPDVDVVERFIETGTCDDTERTFFAHICRVLPGAWVVLRPDGRVDTQVTAPTVVRPSGSEALRAAVTGGRVGILLQQGLAGAALLGTALARFDRVRPLPVHTAAIEGIDAPTSRTPAVLAPLPYGIVRHTAHLLDWAVLERFLADVGEPVPDLDLCILWAVARGLSGDIDILADSSRGDPSCVARVCDRVFSRYGVGVRCPLRTVELSESDMESIVARTLRPGVARRALRDSAETAGAAEILASMPQAVAAALATPHPWSNQGARVDALRRLVDGESVDADALLRAYIVDRWLWVIASLDGDAEPVALDDVLVDGTTWVRIPVRTEAWAPGEQVVAAAAWHVSKAIAGVRADIGPWFAALAGKAVAVGQRRFCPLWDIKPGFAARVLSRVARWRLPRLRDAWTMQVAIVDGGLLPVAAGTVASLLCLTWAERLLPASAWALYPPRPDAFPPADAAVVRGPFKADDTAEAFLDALRFCLPPAAFERLAGCAVLSADAWGSRVLGFAIGPHAAAVPDIESVIAEVCADNPFGQGRERTSIVVAVGS
jgi:hypothetical protein